MSTYTKSSQVRAELTIRRPNGEIETVVWPSDASLCQIKFEKIRAATKAAGRGEVLSYTNIAPEYQMNEMDKHERRMERMLRNSYVKM